MSGNLVPSDLEAEIPKVRLLAESGHLDSYLVLTNADFSGHTLNALRERMLAAGAQSFEMYGQAWFDQEIGASARLRMLVPRLYGLGDLSQILDSRAYAQAAAVLQNIKEDVAKVVLTQPYLEALRRLRDEGLVLLVGDPMAGKSTIASCLALAAVDEFKSTVIKLDSVQQFSTHWNPHERGQLFWLDDVFGVTRYESDLAFHWDTQLQKIRAAIGKGTRMVLASRDYIWEQSLRDLKRRDRAWLLEKKLVVNVRDLTVAERQQITYNHLKLGNQPRSFRTQVKPFLEAFSAHPFFMPEVARRLGDPEFTHGVLPNSQSITDFVARPNELLVDLVHDLDTHLRAALLLVYINAGTLEDPVPDSSSNVSFLRSLDSSVSLAQQRLEDARGSLVTLGRSSWTKRWSHQWSFKHPTISEAIGTILRQDLSLLRQCIRHSRPQSLLSEFQTDSSNSRRVVIPPRLYQDLAERLVSLVGEEPTTVLSFIARRSGEDFLKQLHLLHPALAELASTMSPEAVLALHRAGTLSEEARRSAVQRLIERCIESWDFAVYRDPELFEFFLSSERERLDVLMVEMILQGGLEDWLECERDNTDWSDAHSRIEDLEQEIEELSQALGDDELESHFRTFSRGLEYWRIGADEYREREEEEEQDDDHDSPWQAADLQVPAAALGPSRPVQFTPARSIFDDVDE